METEVVNQSNNSKPVWIIVTIVLVLAGGIFAYLYFSNPEVIPSNNLTINHTTITNNTGKMKPVIYATIVSHNEDSSPRFDYLDTREGYLEGRDALLKMSKLVFDNNASWDYGVEWKFLEAAKEYETGNVLSSTNNKNILRYFSDDLGFQIDPHSHEQKGYSYGDVAYLISQFGISPSNVASGFIAFPVSSADWEKFRNPVLGKKYTYSWNPTAMWGSATAAHQGDEQKKSGIWRPKNANEFFVDDPAGNLVNIGTCDDVGKLIDAVYISKTAPSDKMYNVVIFFADDYLQDPQKFSLYEQQIEKMNEYVKDGYVKWATFDEIVSIWQTEYNSEPNMFDCPSFQEPINTQPRQTSGSCGDGICQDIEGTKGVCSEDCTFW